MKNNGDDDSTNQQKLIVKMPTTPSEVPKTPSKMPLNIPKTPSKMQKTPNKSNKVKNGKHANNLNGIVGAKNLARKIKTSHQKAPKKCKGKNFC